jgi:hypothetical protein
MTTSNDLDLIVKATTYTMGVALKERLIKLINSSKNKGKDKISLALDYGHSCTKSEMRGAK